MLQCCLLYTSIAESGTKNNLSRSITCFDDSELWELESAKEMKSLFETYHNAEGGRIKVDMSIHAEYTSTPKIVRQMAEYTSSIGANMHVHLSETQSAVSYTHLDVYKRQSQDRCWIVWR